jgi:predicted DCC family thiol-disulfide oxidoreductase YuxK
MITVFYDGACGLCAREIKHYQRIAPLGRFTWVDITKEPEAFVARGFQVAEGLKALHAEDDAGRMQIGVAAFLVIWRGLSWPWRTAARIVGLPLVLAVAERVYKIFAAWRFKKLGYDRCAL